MYFHEVLYKIRSLNWKSERAVCVNIWLTENRSLTTPDGLLGYRGGVCACATHVCVSLFIGLTVRT